MLGNANTAEFIAHARQDVPDLVAEVRHLRAEATYEEACSAFEAEGIGPSELDDDPYPRVLAMMRAFQRIRG